MTGEVAAWGKEGERVITDAQFHMYEPETADHPWPREPGRAVPPAMHAQSFTAAEMVAAMEAVGVDRAVIVPPAWAGEEHNNSAALAAASRYPGKFAVMGRLDPYNPNSPERLEHWREQRAMLGIRMSGRWSTTSNTLQDAIGDASLEWYWTACERLGIPIMILAGQFLAKLEPIVAAHPRLRLIVDHLATLGGDTTEAAFATMDDLVSLARYPGVSVKLATAPTRSREPYPFADVHPYLRRVYDAFGAHRMLWEADITQLTTTTYAENLRLWQEGLPFLTDEDNEPAPVSRTDWF